MRRSLSEGRSDGLTAGRAVAVALGLLAVGPSGRLAAQELPNNAGALFLVFPVGAQAVGMGQTATAMAGRGEAAFWNPAGLATLPDDEFEQAHISGAINIPLRELNPATTARLDRDRPVIVYCNDFT